MSAFAIAQEAGEHVERPKIKAKISSNNDIYCLSQAKRSINENKINEAEEWIEKVHNFDAEAYLIKGDIKYLYKYADWGWRTAYLKAAQMGSEEAEEKAKCLIVDNTLFTTTSNPKSEAEHIAHKADSLGNLHEYEQSFGLYLKAAEMGNSKAQLNVARFYLT